MTMRRITRLDLLEKTSFHQLERCWIVSLSSLVLVNEQLFTSLMYLFIEITKEHDPGGLGGESTTSRSIVDRLNYAKTAKHIDLKLLKKELKQEIESREGFLPIGFQSILTSMGRRLSEEMIEQCSISYYFISVLHLCNENNWELISRSLNDLIINANKQ